MTTFMPWSDRYQVGNRIIDQQHKDLFRIINTLHEGRENKQVQKSCFNDLKDYAVKHFITEEEAMRIYRYPEAKILKHVQEHKVFTAQVNYFCLACERGDKMLMEVAMVYLKNWLTLHVLESDRDLIDYFKSCA